MTFYQKKEREPIRHGFILIGILLLHLLALEALCIRVGPSGVRYSPSSLTIDVLHVDKTVPPPPHLSRVQMTESSEIQALTPEVAVPVGADPTSQYQITQTDAEPPPAPTSPPALPAIPAIPNIKPRPLHVPGGQDRYPAESRRARESGEPTITICISAIGTVDSVQIYESSGFPLLDQAALGIGKESTFKPAKLNGEPVPTCLQYRIKFKLGNS